MATRNPSLGLTHHTYNRLQAGCYLTVDLDVKEPAFPTLWYYPIQFRFLIKKLSEQTVCVRLP